MPQTLPLKECRVFRAFKALEEFRGFGAMSDASAAGATVRKELPTHEKSAMVSYTHHLENFGYSSKSKRTSHAIAHHHLLRRPLSGINGKQALEYFNAMATGSKQTIKSKLKILKRFLACCLKANFIIEDYSGLFPSAKKRRYAGIPSVYKPAETATLLDCLKGSSQSRKRNYALALLIAVYGFRSGDIAGMIPCDIDWDDGIIRIVQPKAKSVAERRLFPHAGNALASCLLEERPGNGNPHVFLKQDGGQLASTSASSMIFNALLNCWIYINGRKHGSHSLRHSLAGNMPASDSGMLEASKALGHESADAAKIYYGKKAIMERKPLWKVKPGVYRFY
jgi:integrase